jgi:signal transduction histidine kinase
MKRIDSLGIDQFTKTLKKEFILKNYLYISIVLFLFSIYFYAVNHLLIHASMCIFFSVLFLVAKIFAKKDRLSFNNLVHFQNLFLMVVITFSFFISGGLKAPALFWIPAILYSTLSLIGRRNMLLWLGVGFTIATTFLILEFNGVQFSNFQNESNRYVLHFIHFTLLSLYTFSVAILNEKTNLEYARVQMDLTESMYHQNRLASLGEIVAGVSHEINNPLAIAAGNAAILSSLLSKENIINPEIVKTLKSVEMAHDRIIVIVNSLHSFYRKNNGPQGNTNLKMLIEDTIKLVKKEYANDNIEIIYPKNIPSIELQGSHTQIQQILLNLLSNSRDALENKSDKTIEIYFEENIINKLALIVKDNGDGIPENLMDKVLDPFFTTKDVNKGTGLGLSIIHNIVKGFGGEINITSKETFGTTVKVTLNIA